MLRNTQQITTCAIDAIDGAIGHVKDLYFDDDAWVIRYFVVDTGAWLSGREVLISPISIQQSKWARDTLPVSITRDQVRNSPGTDADKPVSRQNEEQHAGYYGHPPYWGGSGLWGKDDYPGLLVTDWGLGDDKRPWTTKKEDRVSSRGRSVSQEDAHLRSCRAVTGYHIHATDGDVGRVQELIFDDEAWAVRYLVVETSNWWLSHRVLIAPQWIRDVQWLDKSVAVDLTRAAVKGSPPFISTAELSREEEQGLYEHYDRKGYWLRAAPGRPEPNACCA
ncbi:PRC-barrel domain-containing protein [Variovorax sp. LG9.2]|uniref:PRC-barrel domain-containing protein n=1 Tax=Variovorax sp. LG9.2 TaxID=3048626 RepID=UPI002B2342DD|nr:PRC-barrel domain-containing protein [Variovorax sp. LG9.2]MEB0059706.1 PRC-barrel domain-containing protein [Variovorax sp. LG9.2]